MKKIVSIITAAALSLSVTASLPVSAADSDYLLHSTFESGSEQWSGRGSASVKTVSGISRSGESSLMASGREADWNGATVSLGSQFKAGQSYAFSAYVMTEDTTSPVTFYLTLQYKDGDTAVYPKIAEITAEKGQWAHLENDDFTIPSEATDIQLYVETKESKCSFYVDEAGQGAFNEITDDMISKYMPQTYAAQDKASYEQGMIDGKLYYVPANKIGYLHPVVAIRGDLRKKYNMDPLESIDDLYAYMAAIAADPDSGVQYAYNASQNGQFLEDMIAVTGNNLIKVNDYFYYQYEEGKTDYSADDVFFLYDSDFYKEFAQEMKTAAEAGDWSMSSINNQTDVRDSFLNGTSAVYIQNLGTAGGACNSMLQTNPDWEPELYDLNMDKVSIGAYDSDGYAVPYTSKNPERALMALDVLKNNKEAYTDIRYGIPGYHITRNDDGTWSQAEHYGTWSYGAAPSWGLKNTTLEMDQQGTFQTQLDIMDKWKEISVQSPTVGFAFSTTDVSDAWAAMTDVKTQYVPLLQLGLADDIDSTIAELDAQAQAAGIDEIKQAMADQLTAYFSEKTTE